MRLSTIFAAGSAPTCEARRFSEILAISRDASDRNSSRRRQSLRFIEVGSADPSLQFKKLINKPYWSARINDSYRALAVRDGDTCAWFWIGTHADYDAILKQK